MAAEAISNNTRNIQYYILSVVQNNNVYFTNVYTDPVNFKNAILGITHPPVETVCSDALLLGVTAIMEKIEFQMFPNSPIFVFSDGVTNDGYATAGYALQQMSAYRPIVSWKNCTDYDFSCTSCSPILPMDNATSTSVLKDTKHF